MAMQRAEGIPRASTVISAGLVLAGAFWVVTHFSVREILGLAQSMTSAATFAVTEGYAAAPALMLGMALLAALPLIMVIRPTVRYIGQSADKTRRASRLSHNQGQAHISGDGSNASAQVFLEVVGGSNARFAILRDMLRIGREDDNDIRIQSAAVHRYHAAIYREHRDDWHIADLSGTDGNGIRVNGQRCSDARLLDGDVIDFGPGQLRFRARPA